MIVSAIQHFSVGDGDGIRTTVFLKGCNLICPWCHNPETQSALPEILTYKITGKSVSYGFEMSEEEIISEILEDFDFYGDDGGVTFSGGEAMLYADGLYPLCAKLKEKGINIVMDTAGCVPKKNFEELTGLVNTWLYDYKTHDPDEYKKVIGGNHDTVYENLRYLLKSGENVRIRIPLIPDFNVDAEHAEKMSEKLIAAGAETVDLLPFHRLGSSKYTALGRNYAYAETEPMSKEKINEIASVFKKYFKVKIEK